MARSFVASDRVERRVHWPAGRPSLRNRLTPVVSRPTCTCDSRRRLTPRTGRSWPTTTKPLRRLHGKPKTRLRHLGISSGHRGHESVSHPRFAEDVSRISDG
jgi:hypothetical protein